METSIVRLGFLVAFALALNMTSGTRGHASELTANTMTAAPICGTISECEALRRQVNDRIKELKLLQVPTLLDVARDSGGKALSMPLADAKEYCATQGNRLPTAFELAQFAMSHGAKGIVNSCASETNCQKIYAIDNDGDQEFFNYSYTGYRHDSYWVWSSSLFPYVDNHAYYLHPTGAIFYGYTDLANNAVRCVLEK